MLNPSLGPPASRAQRLSSRRLSHLAVLFSTHNIVLLGSNGPSQIRLALQRWNGPNGSPITSLEASQSREKDATSQVWRWTKASADQSQEKLGK